MGGERDSRQHESDVSESSGAGEGFVADDEFYRALAAGPRRRLLAYLFEHETETRDGLAAVLAGWETTETGGLAGPDEHQRKVVELEHRHLPMLADAGLVDYDRQTNKVTLELDDAWARDLLRLGFEADR